MGRGGANSAAKKKAQANEVFFAKWTKIMVPWNTCYLGCVVLEHFFWQGFTFWKAVGAAGLIVGQSLAFFFILHA